MEIQTRADGVLTCPFNHHTPEYAAGYVQQYEQMRAAGPVHWTNAFGGFWVVDDYEHIRAVLMDPETFSVELFDDMKKGGIHIPTLERAQHRPVFMPGEVDGQLHDQVRAKLNPHFSRRRVAEMSGLISRHVEDTFERVLPLDEFDVVAQLASPIVAGVVDDHMGLGIGAGAPAFFVACFEMAAGALSTGEETVSTFDDAWAYLADVVGQRRAEPLEDVISALVTSTDPRFSNQQVQSMVMNVILGAADTTSALTAHLVRHLSHDSALQARLRQDPIEIPRAVEEGLRLFGVSMGVARTALRDTTVAGVQIRAGDRVMLPLPAGNLDPAKYDRPLDFDIDRGAAQHMGMGAGSHFCLGAWLARALVAAIVGALLEKVETWRIVEEGVIGNADKANINNFARIPLRVGALAIRS